MIQQGSLKIARQFTDRTPAHQHQPRAGGTPERRGNRYFSEKRQFETILSIGSCGYVVTLEHIHLLVSEPPLGTLADALKSLKQGVARRLVADADHFWQKRYYDFNVRNEAQFVEKLHSIRSNPVNAGLCGRPEDWPWSSFLHHATGCEGRVEIESEWTARKRERAAGNLCPAVELPPSSQRQA
ncbi:MAG TPA: transposase [Candidatus Sulfotelmatobacter sp.]|nr:transposase [Candidatus Sulfotelmatobacter sp.]